MSQPRVASMYDARSGEKYDIVPSTSHAVFVSKNFSRMGANEEADASTA
jgi:hypothetical protein